MLGAARLAAPSFGLEAMRLRTVVGLGLCALTAISLVVHIVTLGLASACPTHELTQLRLATRTLRDQLREARMALSSERARAQQLVQQQEQQELRHQEQQLQAELDQLKAQHEHHLEPHQVLLPDVDLAAPYTEGNTEADLGLGMGGVPASEQGAAELGAPSQAVARRAAGRHPTFRLAMVVPWLGDSFPSWMPYFLESCKRSDYLVDWLIFHQDAAVPASAPPNVLFVNLGPHGLGVQFGATIAAATEQRNRTYALVKMFQLAFQHYSYIVTEYKPTLGTVLASSHPSPNPNPYPHPSPNPNPNPNLNPNPSPSPSPNQALRGTELVQSYSESSNNDLLLIDIERRTFSMPRCARELP